MTDRREEIQRKVAFFSELSRNDVAGPVLSFDEEVYLLRLLDAQIKRIEAAEALNRTLMQYMRPASPTGWVVPQTTWDEVVKSVEGWQQAKAEDEKEKP